MYGLFCFLILSIIVYFFVAIDICHGEDRDMVLMPTKFKKEFQENLAKIPSRNDDDIRIEMSLHPWLWYFMPWRVKYKVYLDDRLILKISPYVYGPLDNPTIKFYLVYDNYGKYNSWDWMEWIMERLPYSYMHIWL